MPIKYIDFVTNELRKVESRLGYIFTLHIKVGKRKIARDVEFRHKAPSNIWTEHRAIMVLGKLILEYVEFFKMPFKKFKICIRLTK